MSMQQSDFSLDFRAQNSTVINIFFNVELYITVTCFHLWL